MADPPADLGGQLPANAEEAAGGDDAAGEQPGGQEVNDDAEGEQVDAAQGDEEADLELTAEEKLEASLEAALADGQAAKENAAVLATQLAAANAREAQLSAQVATLSRDVAKESAKATQLGKAKSTMVMDKATAGKIPVGKPPLFSGKPTEQTFWEWEKSMSNFLRLKGVHEDQWTAVAGSYLSGQPLQYYSTTIASASVGTVAGPVVPWADFTMAMRGIYGSEAEEAAARHRLDSIVQGSGTVADYVRRFKLELAKIVQHAPSEGDKCYLFRRGLKEPYKQMSLFQHVNGVAVALMDFGVLATTAMTLEANRLAHSSVDHAYGKPRTSENPPRPPQPRYTGAGGASGFVRATGGTVPTGMKRSFAQVTGSGPAGGAVRLGNGARGQAPGQGGRGPAGPPPPFAGTCNKCGLHGHKAAQCPNGVAGLSNK
jgi:hypothetical protein